MECHTWSLRKKDTYVEKGRVLKGKNRIAREAIWGWWYKDKWSNATQFLLYMKPVCLFMYFYVYICTYTYYIGEDAGILCEQTRVIRR